VSAALPVLLATGAVLCGFRAARLVAARAIISRQFVRRVGACVAVLAVASVGQAVWNFAPLAAVALTTGGSLAALVSSSGVSRRPASPRLSSMVMAAYSMLGLLAIAGAVMTYVAAVAVTAATHRMADNVDVAGLLVTPGTILFGAAIGYLFWQAARERLLEPIRRAHA